MTSNSNNMSASQHPLQATASAIATGLTGERRATRMSHLQSANEGPADIIAKVSGTVTGGKREDDSAYFTNNEAHPFPDP
jgi:catalase